jgi:hypothetical protein
MSIAPTKMSADENGHITLVPNQVSVAAEHKQFQTGYELIAGYLRKMGISPDLLTAMRAVPNERLRLLTRAEIVAFGIDRREAVEGAWSFVDQPSGASAVKLIEAKDVDAGAYRTTVLTLSCRNKAAVRLQYERAAGTGEESVPGELRVTAGGGSFPLTRVLGIAQSGNRLPREKYGTEIPLSALDDASFVIESVKSSGEMADSAAGPAVNLTVQASGPALGALARRCSSGIF